MQSRIGVCSLGVASALALFSTESPVYAAEQGASAGNAAPEERGARIEDIVVTAQRRDQILQRVPVAVTALTQTALQANRVADVRDLSALAPNLTVREAGGGVQIPLFTIRGYNTASTSTGVDRGVAFYLDGVYLQNVVGSIFQLADIDRVEVLKGPQGTLFGRNVTGGAISFTTRDPKGEFGIEQTFTYGNYDQFGSKTRVDFPELGGIKAAVTFAHTERDGDIRNLGGGTTWDYGPASNNALGLRTSPKRMGDENTNAVVWSVRFDPTDDLTFSYKGDYTKNRYSSQGFGVFQINAPAGSNLATLLATQPNPELLTPVSRKRPKAVNNWFAMPGEVRQWGHNFTANWDVNDVLSIKNILSRRDGRALGSSQFDGLGGLINTIPTLGPVGEPFIALTSTTKDKTWQWSEEILANLDLPWMHLTAGYLHFENFERRGLPGVPSVQVSRVATDFIVPGTTVGFTENKAKSNAIYAQSEFHLTDKLDVVAGYRKTWDRKAESVVSTTGAVQDAVFKGRKPTYVLGVNYTITNDIFAYAKYSTGYISGGTINTAAYGQETSKSYELGIKSYFFDRQLRSNLTLFSVDYSGLQFGVFAGSIGLPAALGTVVVNGADGKAQGFEWENVLVPVNGLTLIANVGYTDFEISNQNPALGNPALTRPNYRPKWTGNGAIQYETPGVMGDARLIMRVDANYKSKEYLAGFNLTPTFIDSLTASSTLILNARVALADIKVGGGKAQLSLWGRNLTDNKNQTFSGSPLGIQGGQVTAGAFQRARTYGVDFMFKY